MDPLANFITDCCEVEKLNEIYSKELYQAYTSWCEENGERASSQKAFAARLQEKGFDLTKDRKGKKWYGISLNN